MYECSAFTETHVTLTIKILYLPNTLNYAIVELELSNTNIVCLIIKMI